MSLKKAEWQVKPCSYWTAFNLVQQYHYAGSGSKQSVATHGLYRIGESRCYGVTWWLSPPSKNAAASVHDDWRNVLNLSRMVIVPEAPRNAASFLLSRSVKMLPHRWHSLVTYADTWQGHTGTIYKATNWTYAGLTDAKPVWLKDGQLVSTRRGQRTLTKGEMLEIGAELLGYYPKHKFVFYRDVPLQPVQLTLFDVA